MSDTPNECEGCGSYNHNGLDICMNTPLIFKRKCPCRICLIKGICMSACEDLKTLRAQSSNESYVLWVKDFANQNT